MLVGLPGVGKTTVGRLVADELRVPFADLDELAAQRAGLPVDVIFRDLGERWFRQLESEVTRDLAEMGDGVISTGGGWMLNAENRALLHSARRIIYLRASPSTIHRRGMSLESRPLLRGNVKASLERLAAERESSYSEADAVVDTNGLSVQQVAKRVCELVSHSYRGMDSTNG